MIPCSQKYEEKVFVRLLAGYTFSKFRLKCLAHDLSKTRVFIIDLYQMIFTNNSIDFELINTKGCMHISVCATTLL